MTLWPRKFVVLAGLGILILTLAFSGRLYAQDDDVIVIEDLSRSELRDQIERVENEFYRVFNASLGEDQEYLQIECFTYNPTDSYISQRACEPRFYSDARNENVQDWQNQTDALLSPEELRGNLQAEFRELTDTMNEVLQDSDYFRELNRVLRMLRDRMAELNAQ